MLFTALSLLVATVTAATLTVDDSGGSDHATIQDAIDAASSGDRIEIAAGTYEECPDTGGKDLTLQGAGSGSVTVEGDGSAVLLTIDEGETVTVSGLTLTGGERGAEVRESTVTFEDVVFASNAGQSCGAGLGVFEGSDVTLTDCELSSNTAESTYNGGGLCIYDSRVELVSSTVSGNAAVQGGGLYLDASELEMDACTVSGNRASSHGGAFRVRSGSTVTVTDTEVSSNVSEERAGAMALEDSDTAWSGCTFSENEGGTGGGAFYLDGMLSTGTVVDGTFSGNVAAGGGGAIWSWGHDLEVSGSLTANSSDADSSGGAIYFGDGALSLVDVEIADHAAYSGGGVYLSNDATLYLENATFTDNTASLNGGGLYTPSGLTGEGATFSGNEAADKGGGFLSNGGDVELSDSVFTENRAGTAGGGLYVFEAGLVLKDTTVEDNEAGYGGGMAVAGSGESGIQVKLARLEVSGNVATHHGGGMYIDDVNWVSLNSSTVEANEAGEFGGGLDVVECNHLYVKSTVIAANQAQYGAGLYANGVKGGETWWSDFQHNDATVEGGGAVYASPVDVHVVYNSRFVENTAPVGAGLLVDDDPGGYVEVTNVDVVGNVDDGLRLEYAPASSVTGVIAWANGGAGFYADSESASSSIRYSDAAGNDDDWGGYLADIEGEEGNLSADPLYADFQADGDGASDSLLLGSLSPARDAGDPDQVDLDGSRADMGSYGGPDADDGDEDEDGWSRSEGDCDDSDPDVYPGASDTTADGRDQDCDGEDAEGQEPSDTGDTDPTGSDTGDSDPSGSDTGDPDADADGDGWSRADGDCDDSDASVNPGADEVCGDDLDNDCDGFWDANDADCLEGEETACGCGSGAGGATGLALVLGMSLLARRRRRPA